MSGLGKGQGPPSRTRNQAHERGTRPSLGASELRNERALSALRELSRRRPRRAPSSKPRTGASELAWTKTPSSIRSPVRHTHWVLAPPETGSPFFLLSRGWGNVVSDGGAVPPTTPHTALCYSTVVHCEADCPVNHTGRHTVQTAMLDAILRSMAYRALCSTL